MEICGGIDGPQRKWQRKVRKISLKVLTHWYLVSQNFQLASVQASVYQFSSVRFSHSVVYNSLQPHELQHAMLQLSITNSQSLLKLMPIELVMPSSHLILCHPLLFLPPIPPSIRVFSNESTLRMTWPKYWSFSFSISPSSEHPGLISFRMDWLDLLAVQGPSRVFSNTTVQKHQFFGTQLSLQSNSQIHT